MASTFPSLVTHSDRRDRAISSVERSIRAMSFVGPAGLSHQMSDLVLTGPITRADFPTLCARARAVVEAEDCDPVVCDVGELADPDAVTVDALTRLQLTARRIGRRVQLRHACLELQDLLVFMGLEDVLPCDAASGVEPRRQTEEREQARGVEEEREPGDSIA
jgi:ABC-type transporter Mla MlaB component